MNGAMKKMKSVSIYLLIKVRLNFQRFSLKIEHEPELNELKMVDNLKIQKKIPWNTFRSSL